MFELSKVATALLDPRTALFVVLLAGTVLLWTPARRLGRRLVTLCVIVGLSFVLLPIGPSLLHRLEHRFPRPAELPSRVDGIIALGGDFSVTLAEEYGPGSAFSPRLGTLADLGRRYPEARLVFSGGSGRLIPGRVEADFAPQILAAFGLDPARVVYEGQSRNTRENATFSQALVQPKPGETWLLVTSASHVPRAVGAFREVGWPVVPYPVEFRAVSGGRLFSMDGGLHDLATVIRELAGLTYYHLRGWTDAWIPAP
jgi:uncharacterized SAM-binding protein YcdF (DUF218 family)